MNSNANFLSIYPFQVLLLRTIRMVATVKELDYSGKFHDKTK